MRNPIRGDWVPILDEEIVGLDSLQLQIDRSDLLGGI